MKLLIRRITSLLLVVCLATPMISAYAEGTQTDADNISKSISATPCSKIFDFALNGTVKAMQTHLKENFL